MNADPKITAASLAGIVKQYGFDGVDVNYEGEFGRRRNTLAYDRYSYNVCVRRSMGHK